MLMLLFHVGRDRYACSCDLILEIVPAVDLKPIPHTPDYVRGSVIFDGRPLPVVDWCQLIRSSPSATSYHTRIIIFRMTDEDRIFEFGLMAERVTTTIQESKESFVESGMKVEESPFFGGVLTDIKGSIQYVDVDRLVDYLQNVFSGAK